MTRVVPFCLALVAALVMVASSPAAKSGQGTGGIHFELGSIGCFLIATSSDGQQVFAFGPAGSIGVQVQFVGGTSLADPKVGWTCTGRTIFTSVPPITEPLVITGLTCSVERGVLPPTVPLGTLATPGTAIFYRDGLVRLICPPSERT